MISIFILSVKVSSGIDAKDLNKVAAITFRELLELRFAILANSLSQSGINIHLYLNPKNKIYITLHYPKSHSKNLALLNKEDKRKEVLDTFTVVKKKVSSLINTRFPFLFLNENEDFIGFIKVYSENLGFHIFAKWKNGKMIWLTGN